MRIRDEESLIATVHTSAMQMMIPDANMEMIFSLKTNVDDEIFFQTLLVQILWLILDYGLTLLEE